MTRSPRRLKEQVQETVSELPIHAARFAVMGVGRALLLTDRVRKDYREARESGLGPVLGRLKDDAENLTGMVVGKVAGRVSGNGQAAEKARRETEISVGKPKAPTTRPAPPKAPSRPAAAPAPKQAAPKAAAAKPKAAPEKPAAKPKPAPEKPAPEKPAAKPVAAKDLPVSGYDEATLASVRARLRGLDARQVAQLRDYERANAARADFLRMYENRIAKLRGEQ